jgi:hypothetical protein
LLHLKLSLDFSRVFILKMIYTHFTTTARQSFKIFLVKNDHQNLIFLNSKNYNFPKESIFLILVS